MQGANSQEQTTDLDQVLAQNREEMMIDEEKLKAFSQEEPQGEVSEEGAAEAGEKPKADETAGAAEKTKETGDTAEKKAETPPEDKPEKKYRFKDQVEAEKAYVELQRNLSKQGEKLKEFEARTKEADDEKVWSEKVKQADTEYRNYLSERMGSTAEAIDALDEDDPEYAKKVARIRADEQADIRDYERAHPELFGRAVMSRKPEATAQAREQGQEAGTGVDPRQYVTEEATRHDIDPQDPFFIAFCSSTPVERDGKPIPFEEQVEMAIKNTKNYYASLDGKPAPQAEEKPPNNAGQSPPPPVKSEQPLGRGAGMPVGGESRAEISGPLSIDGALERVRTERTL